MQAGTTFTLAEEHQDIDAHFWVILTDTDAYPEQVVIVSLTTYREDKDLSCVVERSEHPTVLTHRSCVAYPEARVLTLAALRSLRNTGKLKVLDNAPPQLLERIRRCAGDSVEMKDKVADVLIAQGIIDLGE